MVEGRRCFLAFVLLLAAGAQAGEPTAFEKDLTALDSQLAAARGPAQKADATIEALLRHSTLAYQRANLTGVPADAASAGKAIEDALAKAPNVEELHFLRGSYALKHHRLSEVEATLKAMPQLAGTAPVLCLKGDLALQRGRYVEAEKAYSAALKKEKTWDGLARMAYYRNVRGDSEGADKLYAEAEDLLSGKEMGSYAWVELQRGYWELNHGRLKEAGKRYEQAQRAYSGHWMTLDYMAELLGAEGRFSEAAVLYEKVLASVPRPELAQALGDLYVFAGKPDKAKAWHDQALKGYLESAGKGEVEYYHHLSGFYADVLKDGKEAVKWARKDLEERKGFAAHDTMAWALFRDQKLKEAMAEAREALKPGAKDSHVLSHAGMIFLAAGQTEEGKRLLKQSAKANPKLEAFHVHR